MLNVVARWELFREDTNEFLCGCFTERQRDEFVEFYEFYQGWKIRVVDNGEQL